MPVRVEDDMSIPLVSDTLYMRQPTLQTVAGCRAIDGADVTITVKDGRAVVFL